MIDLALRMGKIMMPTSKLNGALVRQAFKTLSIYPPARDYIVQMRYKPKPRFRKGLVWSDLCKPSIVGQMFPQPIIETVSRERTLLDDLLDNVLGFPLSSSKIRVRSANLYPRAKIIFLLVSRRHSFPFSILSIV